MLSHREAVFSGNITFVAISANAGGEAGGNITSVAY